MSDFVTEPVLYCLMREDIQDLNPGKAAAQAMHAQAHFQAQWQKEQSYKDWCGPRAFGTTIVLSATMSTMNDLETIVIRNWEGKAKKPFCMIVDPTYPWRNFYGDVFLTSEITCAWWWKHEASSEEEIEFAKQLKLYR